jgi:trans-aconitate methyltransferase
MRKLPKPEVYEQEFEYMPWGTLIGRVASLIEREVPKNGRVLDLMCGPGYLVGEIARKRGDLVLEGVDISEEFTRHARRKYPGISFHAADALSWEDVKKNDMVVCTGGVHHLPYGKQPLFLKRLPSFLNRKGMVVLADPYIDDYSSEQERKHAAAKLGYEYIISTIRNGAPNSVVKAAVDILHNDVMGFEYKTSLKKIEPILREAFPNIEIKKVWPEADSEYGDYYIVCRMDGD